VVTAVTAWSMAAWWTSGYRLERERAERRTEVVDGLRLAVLDAAISTSVTIIDPDTSAGVASIEAAFDRMEVALVEVAGGGTTATDPTELDDPTIRDLAFDLDRLRTASLLAIERQDATLLTDVERLARDLSDRLSTISGDADPGRIVAANLAVLCGAVAFGVALAISVRRRLAARHEADRAAADASRERDRLGHLFDQFHDAIVVLDANGTPTFWSNSLRRMIGDAPMGTRAGFLELVAPDEAAAGLAELRACRAHPGSTVTFEIHLVRSDRELLPVRVTATNHLADPLIRGILVTITDLGRERAAAAELATALAQQQFLAESSSEMLVRADADKVMHYVSAAAEELLHVDPSVLVGWSLRELVMIDDWPLAEAVFDEARTTGTKASIDVRVVTAAVGTWRWVSLTVRHLLGPTGNYEYHVALRDITERHRAELAVQEAAREQKLVLDTLSEGVLVARRGEGYVRVNRAATALIGFREGPHRGMAQLEDGAVLCDERGEPLGPNATPNQMVFNSGIAQLNRIVMLRRPDGTEQWFRVDALPLASRDGEVIDVLATFSDVTEMRIAESALRESERRFRLLADNARDMVALIDVQGRFSYLSPSVRHELGVDPDQLIGTAFTELIHPDDVGTAIRGSIANATFVHRMRTADGTYQWFETTATTLADAGGTTTAFLVAARDVDDRVRTEQRLERERQFLDATLGAVTSAVITLDHEGRVVDSNGRWLEMTGFAPTPGSRLDTFPTANQMLDADGNDVPFERRPIERALRGEVVENEPYEMIAVDGTRRHVVCSAVPLGGDGGAVETIHDITELREAEAELRRLATVDALTGLPNRRKLNEHLEAAVARNVRHAKHLRVVFIDLDGFKPVNDTYGHEAGDELLQQVSRRLERTIRSGDLVARIGGDEFVIVLEPMPDDEHLAAFVTRVDGDLRVPFELSAATVQISASIGTVTFQIGDSADSLLASSDAAMYREKRNRKNSRALSPA
jgi:diguanylate cyclase (GGDEF)-like protein/PAS domain S-box-containing protein